MISAFLPTVVLRIFLVVLPAVLAMMGRAEGLVSLGQVTLSVVDKYFAFQVTALL